MTLGSLKVGNKKIKLEIDKAVNALRPHSNESLSQVHVEHFEIGSLDETEKMNAYGKDNIKNKIYRELDTRRFSMYFSRYMAYQMMLKNEIKLGFQYKWVVHARLDFGWGEPVKPSYLFSPMSIYVPDCWYTNVPDIFAIVPRNISNVYFSIDDFYHKNVFCLGIGIIQLSDNLFYKVIFLGGPNLELKTLTFESLQKRGYSVDEINLAMSEDCRVMFPNGLLIDTPDPNYKWSNEGISG